jgi:diguanylate cyclase
MPGVLHLSNQELQAAIAQLDQAIYSHEQWHTGVLRALIAHLPPDPADLAPDAYRQCRFGRWYEGEEPGPLREHPAFVALGEAHRQMHDGAATLLRKSEDGLDVPINEYDQFTNLLDRMRLEIQSLRSELQEAAHSRDPLTGARNRAGLLTYLREQQALVRRGVQSCALAMVDIDHFKEVNDRHGHAAGDAVLRRLAERFLGELRPYDRLYRYGGEEFLIVMPQLSLEDAVEVGERLRRGLSAQGAGDGAGVADLRVTVSIGIAALDAEQAVEESIDRADAALYRAKEGGRDRVVLAS